MSTELELYAVRAATARDDMNRMTSQVHLYGVASWLKRQPIVGAYLSPADARSLARQLLVAADSADGRL